MYWRKQPTNLVTTLVWDTVVCGVCALQYVRPEDYTDPCPHCFGVLKP